MLLRIVIAHANSHATSSIERASYGLKWTMIGKIATAILDNQWPLHFFPETYIIYNDLHIVQKWTKTERGKLKNFKISVHRTSNPAILPLQVAWNYGKFEPHQLTWIHLKGPLKQYLAESISLQRSNCNILGLTDTVALLANEALIFQIRVFFGACPLQNEVGDPHIYIYKFFFFCLLGKSRSLPLCIKSLKEICKGEHFGRGCP